MPLGLYKASGGQLVSLAKVSVTPPPSVPYIGAYKASDTGEDSWETRSDSYGPWMIRRTFSSNVPASFAASNGGGYNTGKPWTVFHSLKAPPLEIIAGDWDTEIENFVAGGPTDKPWYFTLWHEPEEKAKVAGNIDDWPEGGITFKNIHARMYSKVKAANPMVRMGPVYTYWDWRPGGEIGESKPVGWRPQDWMLPKEHCDFYGLDEYHAATTSNRYSLRNSPSFNRWLGYVPEKEPIAIPEWGRFNNPNNLQARADEILDSFEFLKSLENDIELWCYWDEIGIEGQYKLNDAPSLAAWQEVAMAGRPL